MDKGTVVSTVKQYAERVASECRPSAVVLYGSYAKGNARDDSDIDVAVVFDGFTGDWLKTSARLWRLTEEISYDIEPVLLDSTKDASGFVEDIFKTGQVIYRAA